MAEIVNVNLGVPSSIRSFRSHSQLTKLDSIDEKWSWLQHKLKCNARFVCLFSGNNRQSLMPCEADVRKEKAKSEFGLQEQARKALEGALSGKKNEFEKWDKEIKRREERGGGGDTGGGGGRFGWGRWFGWSSDDNFWREAKQASLTILGVVLIYLLVAKSDLILAVIFNPLLFALRKVRSGFGLVSSKVLKNTSNSNQPDFDGFLKKGDYKRASAKENVVRKWGSD